MAAGVKAACLLSAIRPNTATFGGAASGPQYSASGGQEYGAAEDRRRDLLSAGDLVPRRHLCVAERTRSFGGQPQRVAPAVSAGAD